MITLRMLLLFTTLVFLNNIVHGSENENFHSQGDQDKIDSGREDENDINLLAMFENNQPVKYQLEHAMHFGVGANEIDAIDHAKALLQRKFDSKLYGDRNPHQCTSCLDEYARDKIFDFGHHEVCLNCISKYFAKVNVEGVVFKFTDANQEEHEINLTDLISNEPKKFKDPNIWIQILANGFMSYLGQVLYNDMKGQSGAVMDAVRALQPYFFGYISLSSLVYMFHAYRRRFRQFTMEEWPLTLGRTEPAVVGQLLAAIGFGVARYVFGNTKDISVIMTIASAWSLLSIWSANSFALKLYDHHYLLFHELYPQAWIVNPTQEALKLVVKSDSKIKLTTVITSLFQMFIVFNFVCSASLLQGKYFNDEGEFFMTSLEQAQRATIFSFSVWTLAMIWVITTIFNNVAQAPLFNLNNLTRAIVLSVFTSLHAYPANYRLETVQYSQSVLMGGLILTAILKRFPSLDF